MKCLKCGGRLRPPLKVGDVVVVEGFGVGRVSDIRETGGDLMSHGTVHVWSLDNQANGWFEPSSLSVCSLSRAKRIAAQRQARTEPRYLRARATRAASRLVFFVKWSMRPSYQANGDWIKQTTIEAVRAARRAGRLPAKEVP